MQQHIITANEAGQRFDKFLNKYFCKAGSSLLYKMLRKKNITLNGKKATGKELTSEGDTVESFFSDETFIKFIGKSESSSEGTELLALYQKAFQSYEIPIVYEDNDLLIVNKPAGVLSQQDVSDAISLNEWAIGYLLNNAQITKEALHTFHPSVLNRLDRNTTGAVLIGKSLRGSQYYSELIRTKELRKIYYAICYGEFTQNGEIVSYLHKDSKTNKVTISTAPNDSTDARIHTGFEAVQVSKEFSLLKIELFTGKSHQIRAQLAYLGHPIVGDHKYGPKNAAIKDISYQQLHAGCLIFPVAPFGTPLGDSNLGGKELIIPKPELFRALEHSYFPVS